MSSAAVVIGALRVKFQVNVEAYIAEVTSNKSFGNISVRAVMSGKCDSM